MITSAGAMRSGCGLSGPVTMNERFGAQRVSGVPHTRYLGGLLLTVLPRVFSCFPFWGAIEEMGRSLVESPCPALPRALEVTANFFFFFVMTTLRLGGFCLEACERDIVGSPGDF